MHNTVKAGPKSHLLCDCYWRSQIPGLKFLQLFNQNLRELKYFAFDTLFFAECFQSSRNDPYFFAKTELAVLDNQYCFPANYGIFSLRTEVTGKKYFRLFLLILVSSKQWQGALWHSLKKRGEKPTLVHSVISAAFDKMQVLHWEQTVLF